MMASVAFEVVVIDISDRDVIKYAVVHKVSGLNKGTSDELSVRDEAQVARSAETETY